MIAPTNNRDRSLTPFKLLLLAMLDHTVPICITPLVGQTAALVKGLRAFRADWIAGGTGGSRAILIDEAEHRIELLGPQPECHGERLDDLRGRPVVPPLDLAQVRVGHVRPLGELLRTEHGHLERIIGGDVTLEK